MRCSPIPNVGRSVMLSPVVSRPHVLSTNPAVCSGETWESRRARGVVLAASVGSYGTPLPLLTPAQR